MADPIILKREYDGHIFHQVYIDPLSGKALIMQTALLHTDMLPGGSFDIEAEIFGTMRQPEVERELRHRYWEDFQSSLRQRGVKRITAQMPHHLYVHYNTEYGLRDTGKRVQTEAGELVVAEKWLTQEEI